MKFDLTQIIGVLEANSGIATKLLTPTGVVGVLKVVKDVQAAAADGKFSVDEDLLIAEDTLDTLAAAGIGPADLKALLPAVKALLPNAAGAGQ